MPIKTRGGSGPRVNRDPDHILNGLRLLGSMTPAGMLTRYNLAVADKFADALEPGTPEAMGRAKSQRGSRPRKEGPAPGMGTPEAMERAKSQRGSRPSEEEGGSEPSETRNIYSSAKFIPQEVSDLRDLLSTPPEDIGELEAAVAEQDDEAMEAMAREAASTSRDVEAMEAMARETADSTSRDLEDLVREFGEAGRAGIEGAIEGAIEGGEDAPSEPAVSPEPPAAPEVSEDQLMSDFEVTHGGPFDPNSSMDQGKMEIIRKARTRYPDASPTQLALRIYRGEFS